MAVTTRDLNMYAELPLQLMHITDSQQCPRMWHHLGIDVFRGVYLIGSMVSLLVQGMDHEAEKLRRQVTTSVVQ